MCRHLGHVGPRPVTLASRVTTPEHSLLVQSYAPADMRGGGTVNADGFGVGWYSADGAGHSYRQPLPMWTDGSFLDLATAVESTAFVLTLESLGSAHRPRLGPTRVEIIEQRTPVVAHLICLRSAAPRRSLTRPRSR